MAAKDVTSLAPLLDLTVGISHWRHPFISLTAS
jgi:hypothetical protein